MTREPVSLDGSPVNGSRTALHVVVAAALLVSVALASRGFGTSDTTSGSAAVAVLPRGALESLLAVVVAGAAGLLALFAVVLARVAPRRRKEDPDEHVTEDPHAPWWLAPIAVLLIVAAVAVPIVLLLRTGGARGHLVSNGIGGSRPGVVPTGGSLGGSDGHGGLRGLWIPLAFGSGLVIASAALAIASRKRRSSAPARTTPPTIALAGAVQATIDDIRRDPDPRHAVISAYTGLERDLTEGGWSRRPSRTPFEYVDEALSRLAIPAEPVRSLTELFEVARFSTRHVDTSMKRRAIDALVEVRRALEGHGRGD